MATRDKYVTLHDLLVLKLCALYDVEKQLTKALPKLAKASHNPELRAAFASHLEETKRQAERLEDAAELLDFKIKPEKSEAIRGLIKDAEWIIKTLKDRDARDALLIAAAQYVEHYEMAGYGSARTWAESMGHTQVAELLQEILDEESATNEKLTEIAQGTVNDKANDMPA